MFLLPLGLHSRIVKWPLASLLLIGMTCAASVFYFKDNALYIRAIREILDDTHVLTYQVALAKEACTSQFDENICNYLRANLAEADLWNHGEFFKGLKKD